MRARMKSKIVSLTRDDDGFVHLRLEASGRILSDRAGTNKESSLVGELILRPLFADEIKLGSVITVEVNDEESENRID